jgi:hypothetical protein
MFAHVRLERVRVLSRGTCKGVLRAPIGAMGLRCESAWQACETVETSSETVARHVKPVKPDEVERKQVCSILLE